MKVGPNYLPTTYTGAAGFWGGQPFQGSPYVYNTQNLTATFTSLPLVCRGAYDLTVQLVGTVSAITVVEVDVTLDPQVLGPNYVTTSNWFSIGTIASTPSMVVHSGLKAAVRARSTAVSSTDNFSVVFMYDDRG